MGHAVISIKKTPTTHTHESCEESKVIKEIHWQFVHKGCTSAALPETILFVSLKKSFSRENCPSKLFHTTWCSANKKCKL